MDDEERKQRKRASTKVSQENLRHRTEKEIVSLYESLNEELKRLSQHSKESGEDRKRVKQEIAASLIRKGLASKDAAKRGAAKRLQKELQSKNFLLLELEEKIPR